MFAQVAFFKEPGKPFLDPKLANRLFLSLVYIALVGSRKGLPSLDPKLV